MFIINRFIELITFSMVCIILFDRVKYKDLIGFILLAGVAPFFMNSSILFTLVAVLLYTIILRLMKNDNFYMELSKTVFLLIILIVAESSLISITSFLHIEEPIIITVILIVICILVLIGAYLFTKYSKVDIKKIFDGNINDTVVLLISFLWVSLLILVISYYENIDSNVMVSLFVGFIVFIIFNIILFKDIYETRKENEIVEIKNRSNSISEDCMLRLRANEHEYKNHLNTIYTTLQLGNIDELRTVVTGYVEDIKNKDSLSNLMYVDNVILRAIIYNKVLEAEKVNVKLKYNLKSSLKDKYIRDAELVVILTNLLNNAIEAAEESDDKVVELYVGKDFSKEESKYIFTVKNTVKDPTNIFISSMFKEGVSSKGKDRGYGLSNVQRIVKSNGGDILIDVADDMMMVEIYI